MDDETRRRLPLSALVEEAARRAGSMRKLAGEAIDPTAGPEVPQKEKQLDHQWLSRLVAGRVVIVPDEWQFRAMAAALHMELEDVRAAAAVQWVRVEVTTSVTRHGEYVLRGKAQQLSDDQLRMVLHMVDGYLNEPE